jgi:N-acetyl-anhydromuramyl-L-alanine amidase AmpD
LIKDKNINYSSRRGHIPNIIVNHISEGSKESCINWFTSRKNNNSSTHFLVGRDGSIYQFVKIEDAAWGNGLYLKDVKNAQSSLIRSKKVNPNLYTISIEHEGIYKKTKGALSKEQLKSTVKLHKYIIEYVRLKYGNRIDSDRRYIIGHSDIDPLRKPFCPGEKYPFNEIIKELRGSYIFNDIENHWAEKDIIDLAGKEIIKGNPDGSFRPEDCVKRGELANILNKIIKYDGN